MKVERMKILALSGSLREASFNTRALHVAQALAPDGVDVTVVDVAGIPPYREEDYAQGFPAAVEALRDVIREADAVLIATPEYNYSIPGVLKNAIDWVSRPPEQPFAGKPIAIMGAAAGKLGTARAQYHLRQVFVFLDAHLLNKPEVMIGGAHTLFDERGELTDEPTRESIGKLVRSLVDWANRVG
jgi:chromate reductase